MSLVSFLFTHTNRPCSKGAKWTSTHISMIDCHRNNTLRLSRFFTTTSGTLTPTRGKQGSGLSLLHVIFMLFLILLRNMIIKDLTPYVCWIKNVGHSHKGLDPHYHTAQMNQDPNCVCRWNDRKGKKYTFASAPLELAPCSAYGYTGRGN